MNLKSKLFGTLAASALALTFTTGVMAQSEQADVEGSAELKAGICTIAIDDTLPLSFGTWTYDGDVYVSDGNSVSTLNATLKAAEPDGTCDVTLSLGDGLIGESGTIEPDRFSAKFGSYPFTSLAGFNGHTFYNVSPQSGSGQLRLDSVPADYAPDTYTGDIFIAVANAS